MAFHVACPITCNRICFCSLGFSRKLQIARGKSDFLGEISRIEEFLKDPWLIGVNNGATVHVRVPKVAPPPPVTTAAADDAAAASEELLSAHTKRTALQKKAAVASMASEDFARRFESGALVEAPQVSTGEEQGQPTVNVMCRLCFSGENEGSERAKKMLPCRSCGKKYHRSCLQSWSQHRDLFHWSSWTCPSCRICEVCRRTGEPNKFKYCKRCDGAVHCYCMQPPHKNASSGPYLCPKHTNCHSCGSNVPGNGLSLRWFLGYTCCDACGRLFTKGNYCPVCLKVYRDSESTPMVCCDICQRWVHCQCDEISDERYMQFQADGNLPYSCPTCRGECYQVRDLEDAVRELWRRRDEADRDLIATLRAAAGLPTEEDFFSIYPFSDDDVDNSPSAGKSEIVHAKFSLNKSADFSPKKIKESGKKASSKKHAKKKDVKPVDHHQAQSFGFRQGNEKEALYSHVPDIFSSRDAGSMGPTDRIHSIDEQRVLSHKFMNELSRSNVDRRTTVLEMKSKKVSDTGIGNDVGRAACKAETMKGTKLVIHLGGRDKTITNSPRSHSSNHQRQQEFMMPSCHGVDSLHEIEGLKSRERNIIKLANGKSEASSSGVNGKSDRGHGSSNPESGHIMSSKRSKEGSSAAVGLQNGVSNGGNKVSLRKHPDMVRSDISGDSNNGKNQAARPALDVSFKDSRPLLRLKFKSPYPGSWGPLGEEERGSVKGQRSKRKRPSPVVEKRRRQEEENGTESQKGGLMNEIMDGNLISKKVRY